MRRYCTCTGCTQTGTLMHAQELIEVYCQTKNDGESQLKCQGDISAEFMEEM